MKELTNLSKQFGKIVQESNSLQQRLSGLYEDMENMYYLVISKSKMVMYQTYLNNGDDEDSMKDDEQEDAG